MTSVRVSCHMEQIARGREGKAEGARAVGWMGESGRKEDGKLQTFLAIELIRDRDTLLSTLIFSTITFIHLSLCILIYLYLPFPIRKSSFRIS